MVGVTVVLFWWQTTTSVVLKHAQKVLYYVLFPDIEHYLAGIKKDSVFGTSLL
jgi:hypothetical protein